MENLVRKYSKGFIFYDLGSRQIAWDMMARIEKAKYSELFKNYKIFLKACKELVEELSIDDSSLAKIKCIDKLLELGKFSYGNNYSYDKLDNSRQKIFSRNGIYVVFGKGCCRHLAGFAKDVLEESNEFCDIFYCYVSQEPIKETLDGVADHTINIIKNNGIYMGYDVMNQEESFFISPMQLKSVSTLSHLHYRPEIQMAFEGINEEDLERKLMHYSESVGLSRLTSKDLSEISSETIAKIISKLRVLKDFENSTGKIKEKIYKQMPR